MTAYVLLAMLACPAGADAIADFQVETRPAHRVADLPVTLVLTAVDGDGERVEGFCGSVSVSGLTRASGRDETGVIELGPFQGGRLEIDNVTWGDGFIIDSGEREWAIGAPEHQVPGFLSILPPLFAIGLAIALRQALLALFAGIWLGALFIHGYHPLVALLRTFDTYLPRAIADPDHAAIVVFTLALGGMVGVLAKSGATRALVDVIARRARTRRSGMLASWGAGLVVFFDDYANCMLVGNTLRPLTDRLSISREKLAYIVDSTAAPIATVAVVSTWIGYQLGLFEGVIPGAPYDTFLSLLPYSFYSFFTIAFVVMIAASGRDFGPMLKAERRALEGKLLRDGAVPMMDRELTEMGETARDGRAIDAAIGVGAVIAIVFVGIYVSGRAELGRPGSVREIVAAANSYAVLLWAGFGGSIAALAAAWQGGSITLSEGVDAWVAGVKAMVMAVLILVLAWGIGDICKNELLTGPWVLSQINPDPRWIPVLTFVVSGFVAFATGSSFSTMAIVIPIAGPMAWALTGEGTEITGPAVVEGIRYGTLAAVLSGAVFGDHCSPISDTTIMSSMASASDHVDHVRTQTPYALVCAGAAAAIGFIPAGFGLSPYLAIPIGVAGLAAVVWLYGKPVAAAPVTAPPISSEEQE
jgi:Na+/H+ antiporter NhaC